MDINYANINLTLKCNQLQHSHGKRSTVAWIINHYKVKHENLVTNMIQEGEKKLEQIYYINGYDQLIILNINKLMMKFKVEKGNKEFLAQCYVDQKLAKEFLLGKFLFFVVTVVVLGSALGKLIFLMSMELVKFIEHIFSRSSKT